MRSHLNAGDPVERSLRRLVTRHARAATKLLKGEHPLSVRTIHTVRKRIKRLRAIAMLAENAGAPRVARERRRLTKAARRLSAVRDIDVMDETLSALAEREPRLIPASARRVIRRRIHAERHDLRRTCRKKKTVREITSALARLAKRMSAWQPGTSRNVLLSPGLSRAHQRACEALQMAAQGGDPVAFHTLRKRLTALRNQLLVVAPPASRPHRDAEALDAAVAALGDDHNLTVLWDRLSRWGDQGVVELDVNRVQRAVSRRQRSLRRNAIAAVRRICRTSTKRFVQRTLDA